MRRLGGITLLFLAIGSACGPPAPIRARGQIGALEITDAFAREPITPASGAAYLTIHNTGAEPDTLLSADSPEAGVGTPLSVPGHTRTCICWHLSVPWRAHAPANGRVRTAAHHAARACTVLRQRTISAAHFARAAVR